MPSPEELEALSVKWSLREFQHLKPYLRTLAAFALVMRFGAGSNPEWRDAKIQDAYSVADIFLAHLEKDLKA